MTIGSKPESLLSCVCLNKIRWEHFQVLFFISNVISVSLSSKYYLLKF